ncbi:hypothetical protein UFOVP257_44 [uncultured Caudovirales phage]|uniref:Uncharacterized protein n=1 Tax=uncultured Caudovirales phage TaxID=2100421 RepID=A0A6J5LMV1_9CAUD|nr:hypothetical protein UFOVP257_44 [uncultured Caudovirales phage]
MKSFKEYLTEQELMEESPTTGDYFNIEIAREEIVLETHVLEVLEDGILIEADETMYKVLEHLGYLTESPDSNMPVANDSTSPIHGNNNDEDYPGSRGVWMHGGYKIKYNPETFTLTVQGKHQERGHRWAGKPTKQAYRIAVQQLIDKLEDEAEVYEDERGTSQRAQDAFKDLDAANNSSDTQAANQQDLDKFRDRTRSGQAGKPTKLQDMNPLDRQQWEREKQQQGIKNEAEYQGHKVPLGKPMAGDVKKSKVYVKNAKGNVVKVNFGDPNMRIKKSSPKHRKSFRARHHCENPGPRWKARYWSCRAW